MNILSGSDIKKIITMGDAIDAMKSAFLAVSEHAVTMPLRTPIKVDKYDAMSLFMPAYLQNEDQLGIKIVSINPHNQEKNIPSINGVIVLLDAKTGQVKAILDAEYLTALRTGAASGLATELFAKKDAKNVAILGSGAQAHTQLQAVITTRPIEKIQVWSRSKSNAELFAKHYADNYQVTVHDSPQQACFDADVVCAATSSVDPIIYRSDVPGHCHINAIGSHTAKHAELASDLLSEATVYVDQISAAMAEAGEVIQAVNHGVITTDDLIEIGTRVNSDNSAQQNTLTVFKSVGLAAQDIAVAEKVYELFYK